MDWLFGRFLLLALCALPLTACAEQHDDREVEQPPFYVHFSAGIPLEEREVWGEAAAELNAPIFAATGQYMYWVASGPAGDLCGVEVRHGGELAIERDPASLAGRASVRETCALARDLFALPTECSGPTPRTSAASSRASFKARVGAAWSLALALLRSPPRFLATPPSSFGSSLSRLNASAISPSASCGVGVTIRVLRQDCLRHRLASSAPRGHARRIGSAHLKQFGPATRERPRPWSDNKERDMSNEENDTPESEAHAALYALAQREGHPIAEALERVQNEVRYYSCRPLESPEAIEDVRALKGADFRAGDIARTAVSSFGISPREIFDWCADIAKSVVNCWRLKPAETGSSSLQRAQQEETEANQKIKAYELIGLARLLLEIHDEGDGERVPSEIWNYMEEHYRTAIVVQLANSILSFACELIWEDEDMVEMVEMHVRGIVRQAAQADQFSAAAEGKEVKLSVDEWLVEGLASWCANRANRANRVDAETPANDEEVPHAAQ
jgi:hypothetical protein